MPSAEEASLQTVHFVRRVFKPTLDFIYSRGCSTIPRGVIVDCSGHGVAARFDRAAQVTEPVPEAFHWVHVSFAAGCCEKAQARNLASGAESPPRTGWSR